LIIVYLSKKFAQILTALIQKVFQIPKILWLWYLGYENLLNFNKKDKKTPQTLQCFHIDLKYGRLNTLKAFF